LRVKQAQEGEFSDGSGLLLRVRGDRAQWVRFTAASGKRREMGLGQITLIGSALLSS